MGVWLLEVLVDPETEFMASDQQTGREWELYKENVRPLKRGRKVEFLNQALKCHTDNHLRKSLLQNRRRLIEAIDEYKGDDPLHPWLECIKWVQESFPSGGESSGLVLIYEECVRSFWNSERYKDDLRYLKVWLEYADNCADAEVIYSFLEANEIGQTHSLYYVSYALHMASKNKMKKADDIFNLGISRKAKPVEKLVSAYRKFLGRLSVRCGFTEVESTDDSLAHRNFGTNLSTGRQATEKADPVKMKPKRQGRGNNAPLAILDENIQTTETWQAESVKSDSSSWKNLSTQLERNKENRAIVSKWTSAKIPQRAVPRAQLVTPTPVIEVFVDNDCTRSPGSQASSECVQPSILQLRRGDEKNLKKESELLKKHPLRHFPSTSLPR